MVSYTVIVAILGHTTVTTRFPEIGTDDIWSNVANSNTQGYVHRYSTTIGFQNKSSTARVLCEQSSS